MSTQQLQLLAAPTATVAPVTQQQQKRKQQQKKTFQLVAAAAPVVPAASGTQQQQKRKQQQKKMLPLLAASAATTPVAQKALAKNDKWFYEIILLILFVVTIICAVLFFHLTPVTITITSISDNTYYFKTSDNITSSIAYSATSMRGWKVGDKRTFYRNKWSKIYFKDQPVFFLGSIISVICILYIGIGSSIEKSYM